MSNEKHKKEGENKGMVHARNSALFCFIVHDRTMVSVFSKTGERKWEGPPSVVDARMKKRLAEKASLIAMNVDCFTEGQKGLLRGCLAINRPESLWSTPQLTALTVMPQKKTFSKVIAIHADLPGQKDGLLRQEGLKSIELGYVRAVQKGARIKPISVCRAKQKTQESIQNQEGSLLKSKRPEDGRGLRKLSSKGLFGSLRRNMSGEEFWLSSPAKYAA